MTNFIIMEIDSQKAPFSEDNTFYEYLASPRFNVIEVNYDIDLWTRAYTYFEQADLSLMCTLGVINSLISYVIFSIKFYCEPAREMALRKSSRIFT